MVSRYGVPVLSVITVLLRENKLIFLEMSDLIFSGNYDLTFHANCLLWRHFA